MKAAQINKYGGLDVLEINENVPKPSSGKDQVLVEVYAAGLNPVDWKLREGHLKEMAPISFPATLGGDFAGVVTETGEGVSGYKAGDKVYGWGGVLKGGTGSFAEFVAANTSETSAMPEGLGFTDASSLPLVGVSALQGLEEHIKLRPGQKILIHGGAGGIGSIAIQFAKAIGAYVATTVSTDDVDFAKSLGADQVIDYKNEDFEKLLKDLDAVLDTVGGETTNKSFSVLKKGGVIVSMLGQPSEELVRQHGVTAIGQYTVSSPERLLRLTTLVESGTVKPMADKVFPLEEAKEAFRYLEEVHPRGKVVLEIKS